MYAPTRIALYAALGLALGTIVVVQPSHATPQATTQAQPLGIGEIESAITRAGYSNVRKLKLDDGVWEAKAQDANHRRVKLSVDRFTGKVYPDDVRPQVSAHEVEARLAAAGYHDIHDIEFDDGLWSVDARNSAGQKVDIKVAPDDGHIIEVHRDH